MKRAIELIRVSTEGQAASDRASIPAQRTVNRRTARAYDLEIVRSIEVSDVSGAAVLLSPEIQELLVLINDPAIHGVVAREFSRLMRPENFSDYALLQAFADTRTVLYLPEGPIDFASKTGRLMGTIRAAIAGMERTEMLERIWSAKEEKRRAGGFAQSRVCLPLGVGYEEGRGWHYTPASERVREAFALLLAGEVSLKKLAGILGVTIAGARIVLRNPIYTGWRVIDKRRDPSVSGFKTRRDGRQGDRPKVVRAGEDVIRVKVIDEPLVSEADFARATAVLDAARARNARDPLAGGRFTYNNLLTCALCGSLLYTHFRRRDYYVCKARGQEGGCRSGYMRRETLDSNLDRMFGERFSDEAFLRSIFAEAERRTEASPDARRVAGLESELSRLDAKRGRVLDAFYDGAIDRFERDRSLKELERDAAALRASIGRGRPQAGLTADALISLFSTFREFEFLRRADKRRLLAASVPEIRVADYRVSGLSVLLPRGDDFTRTGTGSSPP